MSVAEITYQPSFSAELVSASRFIPPLQNGPDLLLFIDVPAFGMKMAGAIADLNTGNAYEEVTFESPVDTDVSAILTLHSKRANGATSDLQIKSASISVHVKRHQPRAHFIADSLYAMLGLAGPVRVSIPSLNIDLGLDFVRRPSEVSKFAELRQMEFGLMVIEKATGAEFDIPPHVSGEEMNSIYFSYHAIVKGEFDWRLNEIIQPTPATKDSLTWFDSLGNNETESGVYKLMFGPSVVVRTILDRQVTLGEQIIFIDDATIENRGDVRQQLAQMDGRIVPIRIRSKSRQARYVFNNAPRLPESAWDEKIKTFINLEDTLNEELAARYHTLAASTVADLTPKEIETVIARPELSEDAYLIRE
jgi:hypothetical protein